MILVIKMGTVLIQTFGTIDPSKRAANARRKGATPPLHAIESLLLALANPDEDGRIFLSRTGSPGAESIQLKYQLLNPSTHFREVVEKARSVVLAGGTMSPVVTVRYQSDAEQLTRISRSGTFTRNCSLTFLLNDLSFIRVGTWFLNRTSGRLCLAKARVESRLNSSLVREVTKNWCVYSFLRYAFCAHTPVDCGTGANNSESYKPCTKRVCRLFTILCIPISRQDCMGQGRE
jgi:hypothetical protein